VTIHYTPAYVACRARDADYILGLVALVGRAGNCHAAARQGAFSMRLGVLALVVSVAVSWFSARAYGLAARRRAA